MEKMMGVKESFELRDFTPMSGIKAWWHLCIAIVKIVTNLMSIQRMRGRFLRQFHHELNQFNSLRLEELSNEELIKRYQDFESRILENWKAPLVNDFFTMIFFGSFQKLLEKNNIQHLHNDLLVGSRDIISVKPVNLMISLIDTIKSDELLLQVFENKNNEEVLNVVRFNHPVFYTAFQSYISEFGNRCGEELKLETKTFVTHPERLIEVLKGHLKADTGKVHIDNHVIRENAEKVAIEKVKNKRLFRFMLSKTRTFVSNRENLRYERTSAFAIARKIFRQIGANWKRSGTIDDEDDIFYLNMDEIFSKIKGNSKNVKDTVDKRKRLSEQYSKQHLPERLTTINGIIQPSEYKSVDPSRDLQGIGCCPGIVRGKATKLEKPKAIGSLDGKILLARSTDPGWVTLFASAQALVVERGSLLSHSAIVAREMGIPCVVNIPDLFDSIQEGEELEINGTTGTVKRLSI
jgi:pyruvate,water dikinase